jgi:hypothetical protein
LSSDIACVLRRLPPEDAGAVVTGTSQLSIEGEQNGVAANQIHFLRFVTPNTVALLRTGA